MEGPDRGGGGSDRCGGRGQMRGRSEEPDGVEG